MELTGIMMTQESKHAGQTSLTREQLVRAFDLCVRKMRRNIQTLADSPKSGAWAADGNYFAFKEGFYEIGNWTSSFFTGMALLAWRETEDEYFHKQVLRVAPHYRDKVFTHFMDTHHDLGFLYSLYSVALCKLTGEKEHLEVGGGVPPNCWPCASILTATSSARGGASMFTTQREASSGGYSFAHRRFSGCVRLGSARVKTDQR